MRLAWISILVFGVLSVCAGQNSFSDQESIRLWQAGHDLLQHKDYGGAYDAFDRLTRLPVSAAPGRSDAEYYKAFCAVSLYHADGERLMEKFVQENPNSTKASTAYYDLAGFFYAEKNYPRAISYFSKVDFQSLNSEQQHTGRFRWGYSHFNQKSLDQALDQFNAIKSLGGQFGPAASYYAGFIEISKGDLTNALIDLKRAEENASYADVVPVMIMDVYNKQSKDDDLVRYGAEALKRENVHNAPEISLLAGEAWFRKGKYAEAFPLYEEYLGNASNRGVAYRAGLSAYALGKDTEALKYFKDAAGSAADSLGAYASYQVGLIYLKRQEKPLALTAFELARKFKGDTGLAEESLFQCAKINYDLGRPDISIQEFESLLQTYPQSTHGTEVRELLSQAYVNANNYNKAIAYIDALPSRTPAVDKAYQKATYLKGTDLFNQEEYAEAVSFFVKSLERPIDPEIESDAARWCGEAYSIGRKYEQAIPFYERALATSRTNANEIHYGLGYAHFNLRAYDKALPHFRAFVDKASGHSTDFSDGLIRLSDCYFTEKLYAEALSGYRKALLITHEDADYVHLQAGLILAVQRKYNEAAAEFDAVQKVAGSRYAEDAVFQRAQIEFEQNHFGPAATYYSTLITQGKSARLIPYALSRRAAAYFNLKNYDQTANDYIALLEKYPTHPAAQDLLLPLQEALNLANRTEEFDKYLALFKQSNPDAKGIESVEFETAKNLYFNQNYQRAIESLSRFRENYPASARLSEAMYYEAESYYRIRDLATSLKLYYEVANDITFTMQNKVVGRIAEVEFRLGQYDKALPAFKKLERLASNKKDQHAAWNGLMDTFYLLASYDSSEVYARKILENGNINASAQNKASLYLGKTAMARGDYETAKDEFLTTLNMAHDEYGAEAQYSLGEIFYLTKAHKQCYEALLNVNRDFGSYEDWVAKSYLLLADNFLAMGDSFQAKGTLKSLVDNFPKEEVKEQARQRLKKIEDEELKKEKAKSDTTGNGK